MVDKLNESTGFIHLIQCIKVKGCFIFVFINCVDLPSMDWSGNDNWDNKVPDRDFYGELSISNYYGKNLFKFQQSCFVKKKKMIEVVSRWSS